MIPYARQSIDEADIAAVVAALRSDFLTQGSAVGAFESDVAALVGAQHAVAASSATAALHIALLALGVGRGDLIWTSPNSFVASANCARYCEADVDFVDIDERTYNLSPARLEEKFARAARTGRLPTVLIPVHFAGQPCEMREIRQLAQRFGCRVVEDASHAIGATYAGKPVGACEFSDMTVFSFHAVKIVTSAEGGMCVTNDPQLAARLRLFRSHGITREPGDMERPPDGAWSYEQIELGYNYRLTDIQAALGSSQVRRIGAFIARRRAIARQYDRELAALDARLPWQQHGMSSAYHLYPVCVADRAPVYAFMHAAGVAVNVHYIPIHRQPYYRRLGFKAGDFPAAERFYAQCLSLPMYVGLSDESVAVVCAALRGALAAGPALASMKTS